MGADGLPLSGDYRGMGGPESVPLSAPPGSAFDRPASLPHSKCLLDDLGRRNRNFWSDIID